MNYRNHWKKRVVKVSDHPLGLRELVAIALGGMIGGGIFSILGIAVEKVGKAAPLGILIGGVLAFFAAYSYVKLALLYKDEGATYSFFKLSFPKASYMASAIGWLVVFGYISTLALYAFTFASYFNSLLSITHNPWANHITAGAVLCIFCVVNVVSVSGMGKIEDMLVYLKLALLLFISVIIFMVENPPSLELGYQSKGNLLDILIVLP